MFIIYHNIKLQMPSSNDALHTAIHQLKAKYKFHTVTIVVFILHKNYLKQHCTFLEAVVTFQDPVLSNDSVVPISKVHASALLLLQITEK
jgi:hypothetical protein